MSERVRGSVINVHNLGAIVRLEDGRLVAAPIGDVNKNRSAYTRALEHKDVTLPFDLVGKMVVIAQTRIDEVTPTADVPPLTDPSFEAQIAAYLKSTEEWAPSDRPQPFERHLVRKRQRAKFFESRAE
ncbi:MAG: hypothetical protein QOF71_3117 [Candidatus Eremiobacteraeota bacterium]|nr:hypothetical protein [Candidatus Eremiobacteraeota bacterium]